MKRIIKDEGFEGNPIIFFVDNKNKRVYVESFLIRTCSCGEPELVKFKAIAKTHPEDKFDENFGIKLAERRLAVKIHKFLLNEAKNYKEYLEKELNDVNKYLEVRNKKLKNVETGINELLEESHKKYEESKKGKHSK